MRTNIFKFAIILLLLAGSFYSCNNEPDNAPNVPDVCNFENISEAISNFLDGFVRDLLASDADANWKLRKMAERLKLQPCIIDVTFCYGCFFSNPPRSIIRVLYIENGVEKEIHWGFGVRIN